MFPVVVRRYGVSVAASKLLASGLRDSGQVNRRRLVESARPASQSFLRVKSACPVLNRLKPSQTCALRRAPTATLARITTALRLLTRLSRSYSDSLLILQGNLLLPF